MKSQTPQGSLYVVATPIGHLKDITLRAIDVLKQVQIVAAEDTRHSQVLLQSLSVQPREIVSLHDHNEASRAPRLLEKLKQGRDVALISDAGTPLLCDPGFKLVRMCRAQGVRVIPVPGCSALTAVLSVSSIPVDRFFFQGFLPARATQRQRLLQDLVQLDRAVVFYEAPHRINATMQDLAQLVSSVRRILVARELTKIHETIEVGTVSALAEGLKHQTPRGEFVCVLEGSATLNEGLDEGVKRLLNVLSAELPATQAARIAAKISGIPRSRLYEFLTRKAL